MTSTLVPPARSAGGGFPDPVSGGRLHALDGLRGLAAVVVLFHHTLLAVRPQLQPPGTAGPDSLWWWLDETPLKAVSAGGEAVVLFFVLSGLVVALPAMRGGSFTWSGFLASRIVRIMAPAWGALLFASALLLLIPRDTARVAEGWLTDNTATSLDLVQLGREASLSVYSYQIDNVLWSLRWELIFAVILPVFLLAVRAVRRAWWVASLACVALSFAGFAVADGTLSYLPAFLLGTLMAARLDAIRAWGGRIAEHRLWPVVWVATVTVALLCMAATWMVRPFFPELADVSRGLSVIGSAALIGLALTAAPVARWLSSRVNAWLGRVSFSLYLVHVPILVATGYLVGEENWWLIAPVGIPLSFLVAAVFFRFVEKPTHSLARSLGRLVGGIERGSLVSSR